MKLFNNNKESIDIVDLVEQAAASGFNQKELFDEFMTKMDNEFFGSISMEEFFVFLIETLHLNSTIKKKSYQD